MPHVVKSTILNAPTDAAWAVLRDFNGHDRWHPAVATSTIERAQPSDKVGCVRRFKLQDGSELREQLLALSDLEYLYATRIRDETESENIRSYLCLHAGPFVPQPEEIDALRFWTRAEIIAALGTGVFTSNFEEEFAAFAASPRGSLLK